MKIDLTRNENLVAGVIIAFCLAASIADPGFLSIATLTDLLRNAIVLTIFAVAAFVVLVSGGIDVSFTAVAAVTMYVTAMVLNAALPWMPWYGAIAFAMVLGGLLGCINGILIAGFGLPTLIVTLGTMSIFRGFMLTFIGQKQITTLPPGMREFGRMVLFRGENADGSIFSLHAAFVVTVLVVVVTWFILNRTMLGRQVYAIGGSVESARRIGIKVRQVQFMVYVYVGSLAGLAGMIHSSMARVANPFDLVGLELSVIAAVVLGGARLAGGYGTLTGTILGVALIVLVRNSLIVLGIPNTFQSITIGILILIGTGLPAWQAKRAAQRSA